MSPPRASVKSCAAADGQRDSLMISMHFIKEICQGKFTCTCVGGRSGRNKLSLSVAHQISHVKVNMLPQEKATNKKNPRGMELIFLKKTGKLLERKAHNKGTQQPFKF